MVAPSYTARIAPTGEAMREGFVTKITFFADPNVTFWEKGVTPPPLEAGDPIDVSTQYNTKWKTFGVPTLVTQGETSIRVAYDPLAYSDIIALIGVSDVISVLFPVTDDVSGDTLAFYGYLKSFEPDEMVEGSQPEATITIATTNLDTGSNTEEAPVYAVGA